MNDNVKYAVIFSILSMAIIGTMATGYGCFMLWENSPVQKAIHSLKEYSKGGKI